MRYYRWPAWVLGALVLFVVGVASAEPPPPTTAPSRDVAALQAAGGTVTEAGGVVTKLAFKDCSKLGEAEFARIGRLKGLKSLTLFGGCAGLTDSTLPLLTGLTALEELSTEGIQVSDDGLKQLAALTELRSASFFHLSLKLKEFTGAGFVHLKPLSKLERLTVAGTTFNDEGMAAVAQLTQLHEFRTWHTHQTAAGTAALQKLTDLRTLRFGQRLRRWDGSSNALTLDDTAIGTMAKLTSLESLTLDEARLTYQGVSQLKALPKLKTLSLEHIAIPPDDVERLRSELPNVTITWKPMDAAEVAKLETSLKP